MYVNWGGEWPPRSVFIQTTATLQILEDNGGLSVGHYTPLGTGDTIIISDAPYSATGGEGADLR